MSEADPRIDAYIAAAQPFARPILAHLRQAIHAACPDAAESIKWGRPAFSHAGRVFAVLGAFKAHAAMTLWRMGDAGETTGREQEAQGQFGRLTRIADLPDDAELARLIGVAVARRTSAAPRAKKPPRAALPEPAELTAALAGNASAKAAWDGFAPSHRREYSDWIGEAKRPETRVRRVAQAIAWLSEGKSRNWKYQG